MKSLVKEILEEVTGKSINNESHAVIILKGRLTDLGGGDFAQAVSDIPSLLEFIEIYDPEVSESLSTEFWNALELDPEIKRKGKVLNPSKYKMDRAVVESVGKSIASMHEGLKFVVHSMGVSILKNNRVICAAKKWRAIEGPIKEYSAEVIFNHIDSVDTLKSLVPKRYWDGKTIEISKSDFNKPCIRYMTTVELIDTFTNNKIVEESCLKDG